MADTFQSMVADRARGNTRARLVQFYVNQGYSPEAAAGLATAEMARRGTTMDYGAGDSPRESVAVRTANDALAQRREMNDRDLGPENRERMAQMYRSNPMLAGLDEPPAQLDQFRETAPTAQDIAAMRLRERQQAQADRDREVAMPWYEMPAYRNDPSAIRARQEAEGNFERNLRENSARVGQAAEEQRRRDLEVARQALDPRRLDIVTAPREGGEGGSSGPGPMPSSATTMPTMGSGSGGVDRVDTTTRNEIDNRLPSYPFFSYSRPDQVSRLGGAPQNVPAGPLAIGGQGMQPTNIPDWNKAPEGQFAPYLMQNRPNFMKFSRDEETPMASRIAKGASNAGPASAQTQQTQQTAQTSQPWYARFMPSDPYAGMSAAKLMERANANPDDAAAFFRADAALRKERPEMFEKKQEEGMARGGAAGGGHHKDAVVMKALEIIHHMLRGR
jgi:hypothetical protein